MDYTLVFMIVGFLLAAYSIIANDAIQTLGTFIGSNQNLSWYTLWLYAATILVSVLVFGYLTNSGDVSYGRLEKFGVPEHFSFVYIIPPLIVLMLTRFGIPVSTTFIILTIFSPTVLSMMLVKSLMGYFVAFFVGLFIYRMVVRNLERHFLITYKQPYKPYWRVLQWLSTAFLWSQWLIQDLANIFVYMPTRSLDIIQLISGTTVLVVILGIVFYTKGGSIQNIVRAKTNTADIRVATIIDFVYGIILLIFKEYSNIPMSTTWVFIGLLAGREYAMSLIINEIKPRQSLILIARDIGKATIGLVISVVLALSIPVFL